MEGMGFVGISRYLGGCEDKQGNDSKFLFREQEIRYDTPVEIRLLPRDHRDLRVVGRGETKTLQTFSSVYGPFPMKNETQRKWHRRRIQPTCEVVGVLYADKVVQETAFQAGLRNAIVVDGGVQGKGAAANSIYNLYEAGRIETTEAEREAYVASVPVPLTPTNLTTLIGNGKIILFFDPPTNTSVDSYTVTSSPEGIVSTGASSPIVVSGITNGTSYTLSITATNSVGTSEVAVTGSIDTTYAFTITTFTATGSSSWTAPAYVTSVEYLLVGGGGGGGNGYDTAGGGGGGAGMVLEGNTEVVSGTTYTIQVGSGGAGGGATRRNIPGQSGNSSEFNGITALGGGGGGGSRTEDQTPGGYGVGGLAQDGSIAAALGGNGGKFYWWWWSWWWRCISTRKQSTIRICRWNRWCR